MRRVFLALTLGVLALWTGPVRAASGTTYTPFAFETITISSTALPFTVATAFPSGQPAATLAVVTIAADSIRHREDGIAPTAAVGHLETAGTQFEVKGEATIRQFQMIRVTSDSTVSVTYYREGP